MPLQDREPAGGYLHSCICCLSDIQAALHCIEPQLQQGAMSQPIGAGVSTSTEAGPRRAPPLDRKTYMPIGLMAKPRPNVPPATPLSRVTGFSISQQANRCAVSGRTCAPRALTRARKPMFSCKHTLTGLHTNTRSPPHTRTYTHTHTRGPTNTHAHPCTHKHTPSCIHSHMQKKNTHSHHNTHTHAQYRKNQQLVVLKSTFGPV